MPENIEGRPRQEGDPDKEAAGVQDISSQSPNATFPSELIAHDQWLLWRREVREKGPTKPPFTVDWDQADVTNPETWTTFEEVKKVLDSEEWPSGLGFVFTEDDPFCGIDLDNCFIDGKLPEGAAWIVRALNSYTEITPSGSGLHVIVKGKLSGGRSRTGDTPWGGVFEVYDRTRYFTMTGNRLQGSPKEVFERQSQLDGLIDELLPEPELPERALAVHVPVNLSDDALLDKAHRAKNGGKFTALFDRGDVSTHGRDDSAADLALCTHLAFWTGGDPERIDRLFRRSALMREKWYRDDYRDRTIEVAIAGCESFFGQPPAEAPEGTLFVEKGFVRSRPEATTKDEGTLFVEKGFVRSREDSLLWPTMQPETLHGLAGEVVESILPHTEADPAALLLSFLSVFGSAASDKWYAMADGSTHPARINCVLVGATSSGRKGTAFANIRRVFAIADHRFVTDRITHGLASGEGLIAEVADPPPPRGNRENPEEDVDDRLPQDKRLLVVEAEFGRSLKVGQREGNTLSAVIRSAWDSGELRVMTRHRPLRASDAHISVLGQITKGELRRLMTAPEQANGFGNRFLFGLTRRSKKLPEGGNLAPETLNRLGREVSQALLLVRRGENPLVRSEGAKRVWAEIYYALPEPDGLLGAVTARAAAQMLRLQVVFAMLDGSKFIHPVHVEAAKAVWDYCEASAEIIFSDATDPDLLRYVEGVREAGEAGLDGRAQSALFDRNLSADKLDALRSKAVGMGLVTVGTQATGGRPRTVVRAAELRTKPESTNKGFHQDGEADAELRTKPESTNKGSGDPSQLAPSEEEVTGDTTASELRQKPDSAKKGVESDEIELWEEPAPAPAIDIEKLLDVGYVADRFKSGPEDESEDRTE